MIELKGLALSFPNNDGGEGTPIFRDLDLTIQQGEFLVVLGPSGTGKSTLLRIVAGLLPPTDGTVHVDPKPDGSPRRMGFVFQDARLLPWRTAQDNVAFGLERSGLPKAERRRRACARLKLVGLEDLANRWPFQMSGGQRQRVALARALAIEPDILLMDEPFAALDAFTRREMQDELVRLWEATGTTILFVTHDIDEARYLADRVVVLAGTPARIDAVRTVPESRKERSRKRHESQRLDISDTIGDWTI